MQITRAIPKYIAEFIGTLVFLTIILKADSKYAIVAGLLAAILFMGDISGGNFNPAVSVMMAINGNLSMIDLAFYIISQLAGAVAATQLIKLAPY